MLDKVWFHLFSCSCSFKLWLLKNRMDDLRRPSALFLTDSSQSEKVLSNVLRVFFLTPTFPPKRKKPQLTTRHSYNWFYVLLYHCKTTKSLNQYKHKRTMYSYLKMFFFSFTHSFPCCSQAYKVSYNTRSQVYVILHLQIEVSPEWLVCCILCATS